MNELLIENKGIGKYIEILNYDKSNQLALVRICGVKCQPYVVAHHLDLSDGSWAYGTYFQELENAKTEFRLCVLSDSIYEEAVKVLLSDALDDMDLSMSELNIACDWFMNQFESPTYLDYYDVENTRAFIEGMREDKNEN